MGELSCWNRTQVKIETSGSEHVVRTRARLDQQSLCELAEGGKKLGSGGNSIDQRKEKRALRSRSDGEGKGVTGMHQHWRFHFLPCNNAHTVVSTD
jgi:hypothetical protein